MLRVAHLHFGPLLLVVNKLAFGFSRFACIPDSLESSNKESGSTTLLKLAMIEAEGLRETI